MGQIRLFNGDCLDVMDKLIEKGVKVDAIITDLSLVNICIFRLFLASLYE